MKKIITGIIVMVAMMISFGCGSSMQEEMNEQNVDTENTETVIKIESMYLYSENEAECIAEGDDAYDELSESVIKFIHNNDARTDYIDGTMIFEGNGASQNMSGGRYLLEINLLNPITTYFAENVQNDISRLVFDIDHGILYLYQTSGNESAESVAGFECAPSSLEAITDCLSFSGDERA